MRPVVNSTFVTLDGVINHMDRWHFDYVDAESDTMALDQLEAADALLMGRNTYEIYAAVWPQRDDPYAKRINSMRKYVASSQLTNPQWDNTTVIGGDLVDTVADLRAGEGGNLLMHGFGPVAKTLLAAGLLDELHLWYHPALVGIGGPGDVLFTDGLSAELRHIHTRQLGSGVVILSYRSVTK
ncbi:MAG: dihydrofolate reductase family protein [Ilumatobacteraceae bacterium]